MELLERRVTEYLNEEMKRWKLPGYDCAIYLRGKPVYRHMEGYANIEEKIPVTENTLYHIYSNTKVITCVAALQLYEQGKFLLEDKLERFYPEFTHMKVKSPEGIRDAKTSITIRDLFCMTAGIDFGQSHVESIKAFYAETNGKCPLSEMPRYLTRMPLEFDPGTEFYYGLCHDVLGALISRISGMTFSEYLQKNIFDPLDMKNTSFYGDKLGWDRIACQYRYHGPDKPLTNEGNRNTSVPEIMQESGGGGLITSVNDYMKFQEGLRQGKLISRATMNLMRLNQLKGKQWDGYGYTGLGMGYGLGVETIYDQALAASPVGFGPFGWGGAQGSHCAIDPERELNILYMQCMFDNDCYGIYRGLRNVVYTALSKNGHITI